MDENTIISDSEEDSDNEVIPPVNVQDRAECDRQITELLYKRTLRKSWATKTRNVCINLRARMMVGAELKETAGHHTLMSANVALANMTEMFTRLDNFSTEIQSLHDCRFMAAEYEDLSETIRNADNDRREELAAASEVFVTAYNTELGRMETMIDLLNAKLMTAPAAAGTAAAGSSTSKSKKKLEWKENRMFKPHETLNKDTSPAEIDLWVESMEQYADSSNISRANNSTQHFDNDKDNISSEESEKRIHKCCLMTGAFMNLVILTLVLSLHVLSMDLDIMIIEPKIGSDKYCKHNM